MKRILLSILLLHQSFGFYANGYEPTINDIYELAKSNIVFDVFSEQKYEKSKLIGGFDFFNFQETNQKVDSSDYYKVYSKSDTIRKISRYSKTNKFDNYDVFFFPTKDFIFYTIYMYDNESHQIDDGYFVKGFFFRFRYNRFSYFLGLSNTLLPVIEYVDEIQVSHQIPEGLWYHFPKESTTYDIEKILFLNQEWEVEKRLNYYKGKLISNSWIKYKDNDVYEVLELLSSSACSGTTNLDSITMSTLISIEDRRYCHSYYEMLVKPDYPEGRKRPLWSYNDRYYLYDLSAFESLDK